MGKKFRYALAPQPIYRDSIINGKFLAGTTLIFLMIFSMGIFVGALGLLVTGIAPAAEELGQSLLLVWPHLAGLMALMLVTFAGSYICFMRQEIRSK